MNNDTKKNKSKLVRGVLAAVGVLGFSSAAVAANVPAWMGRIQADSCVTTAGYTLSFDTCPHNRFHYANVPLSVNAGTSDVAVSASFVGSNQGDESGCYDDDSCARLLTLSATGVFTHTGAWACDEARTGIPAQATLGTGTVPRGGYAGIELRGYHSNGCGNRIKAIRY